MTMNLDHTCPSSEALCRRCQHYSHSCYLPCAMNPLGPTDGHCPDWKQVGPNALPTAGVVSQQAVMLGDNDLEVMPRRRLPGALQILQHLVAFLVTL